MVKEETIKILNNLKKRAPKLSILFIVLVLLIVIMYAFFPILTPLRNKKILNNLNLYQLIRVTIPIISLIIIFEISKQIAPIMDELSELFCVSLPGIKSMEKLSIRRILTDLTYIIIIILTNSTFSSLISEWSKPIGVIFNIIFLIAIAFLVYDIGKIGFRLLEENINKNVKKISKNKKSK